MIVHSFFAPTNPDSMFDGAGNVRLPAGARLAVTMARRSHGCLSRQPTLERAEAVAAACKERLGVATVIRGSDTVIREPDVRSSYGVFLADRDPGRA